jgi:hypothetical protein
MTGSHDSDALHFSLQQMSIIFNFEFKCKDFAMYYMTLQLWMLMILLDDDTFVIALKIIWLLIKYCWTKTHVNISHYIVF